MHIIYQIWGLVTTNTLFLMITLPPLRSRIKLLHQRLPVLVLLLLLVALGGLDERRPVVTSGAEPLTANPPTSTVLRAMLLALLDAPLRTEDGVLKV